MTEATQFSLFKRSNGLWYILYVQDGRRRWKSTKSTLKSDALKALSNFKELYKAKDIYTPISSFEAEYLAYSASVHKSGTQEGFKFAFKDLRRIIGDISLHKVGIRDVEKLISIKTREASLWRARTTYIYLRSAFETARRWELIRENPFAKVPRPKTKELAPVYLSRDDLLTLIDAIADTEFRALVVVAFLTGLRLSELASLEWTDIDLVQKVIFVQNKKSFSTKSNRNRVVPMNDALAILLEERNRSRPDRVSLVFHRQEKKLRKDYISKTFKNYVKHAKLDKRLHFHSLRHSFASNLVSMGASLYEVQKLLGHASSQTTQIYSHLLPEQLHKTVNRIDIQINADNKLSSTAKSTI